MNMKMFVVVLFLAALVAAAPANAGGSARVSGVDVLAGDEEHLQQSKSEIVADLYLGRQQSYLSSARYGFIFPVPAIPNQWIELQGNVPGAMMVGGKPQIGLWYSLNGNRRELMPIDTFGRYNLHRSLEDLNIMNGQRQGAINLSLFAEWVSGKDVHTPRVLFFRIGHQVVRLFDNQGVSLKIHVVATNKFEGRIPTDEEIVAWQMEFSSSNIDPFIDVSDLVDEHKFEKEAKYNARIKAVVSPSPSPTPVPQATLPADSGGGALVPEFGGVKPLDSASQEAGKPTGSAPSTYTLHQVLHMNTITRSDGTVVIHGEADQPVRCIITVSYGGEDPKIKMYESVKNTGGFNVPWSPSVFIVIQDMDTREAVLYNSRGEVKSPEEVR